MPSELWKRLKQRLFVERKGLSEISENHPKYELTRESIIVELHVHIFVYTLLHFLHRLVKHLSKKIYSVNMILMENFVMLQI